MDSAGVFGVRRCMGAALSPHGLQALGEGEEKAMPWTSCCSKQAVLRFYPEELSASNLQGRFLQKEQSRSRELVLVTSTYHSLLSSVPTYKVMGGDGGEGSFLSTIWFSFTGMLFNLRSWFANWTSGMWDRLSATKVLQHPPFQAIFGCRLGLQVPSCLGAQHLTFLSAMPRL